MGGDLLVPGRECGPCTVCCSALTIDVPELKKPADIPCRNLSPAGGCGIYDRRPEVCRSWYCGWRMLPQLGDDMRPDGSGVLVRLDFDPTLSLVLQALRTPSTTLVDARVLTLAATFIDNGIRVSISIPGRPGHMNSICEINQHLAAAVRAHDLAGAQEGMLRAIEVAQAQPTEPVGVSRIASCPCGSGVRFKDCHGSLAR